MSARVRRPGEIQVHGVTVHGDVVWQIGNGPVRETWPNVVIAARRIIGDMADGLVWVGGEAVNESDLDALHDALKARNRGATDPLCLSCHRASVAYGLDVCSGCNDGAELVADEPRRVESDAAFINHYDLDPNTDEEGHVRTPGQWSRLTWGF